MKTLKDQGDTINRPTKQDSSFFLSKSLLEPIDNNSNLINTIPSVDVPSNTLEYTDVSLLNQGIDFLEQFFDTQLQNLTQISPVKSTNNGTNTNKESDILIESPQDTISISQKELIDKKNTINNLSIILKNITPYI